MKEYRAIPYVPGSWKVKSPLRYPGGKFYALKHIMPYIECVEHDEYREPFLGGGSVFFAKQKVQYNILNDLEQEIIHFYKSILDDEMRNELISRFDTEVANKKRHNEVKQMLPTTSLERAFKTYYLNRNFPTVELSTCLRGDMQKEKVLRRKIGESLLKIAAEKLRGVELFSLDYADILELPAKGKSVLTYLDPPYFHADQKRAYTKPFTLDEHFEV
ncbi:MAG: DNA adenine methylase [Acutalibacteraceae bacterium]